MWNANSTLNNQWFRENLKGKSEKNHKMNENKNTTYQTVWMQQK